jgi:hypothetical protein
MSKLVYRACSYLELEKLFILGELPTKYAGGYSFSLNKQYAKSLLDSSYKWILEANPETKEKMLQSFLVTFDLSKLKNPIEIVYELNWFLDNPNYLNSVLGTDANFYVEKAKYDIEGVKNELSDVIRKYSAEREIICAEYEFQDGLILEIESNSLLLNNLGYTYFDMDYKYPIKFKELS